MARKRAKVVRAIEPNAGGHLKAARRMRALVNAFENEYKREALKLYASMMHSDKTSDAPMTRTQMQRLMHAYLTGLKARLLLKMGERPRKVSRWYCSQLLRHITADQKRAMTRAGISNAWLKQKWTVPVLKGQYIAPEAAKKIPEFVDWSTGLITKLCEASAHKVQNAIADGIDKGHSLKRLTQSIGRLENMDPDRAARVALDQSCKLNQFIQVENAKSLGVTEGIWVHVPGKYTSRDSHINMNGKRFKLDEGMYDPDVGFHVQPAELPYCRCCFRAVLPGFLVD